MTTVTAESLESFLTRVFEAAGTPADIAPVAAEHLVRANLSGHDSHGAIHITHYLNEIRKGVLVPDGRPEVLSRRAAAATVDAHHGWGLYAGMHAIDLSMEMAREAGVGAVSVKNCTHIGRLGHYAEEAAARGFISMITWGAGEPITWGPPHPALHLAAPYGGAAPALSTNPIAFGVPTGDDQPFVIDFATTAIANAKAWIYRERGEQFPTGCALDKEGRPTTDPAQYMDGGTLVIFGGHKGSGISLLTCLLGGLTGTYAAQPRSMDGPFFLALDPGVFGPPDHYQEGVRSFLDGIRATPVAPGFEEVLAPGDFEVRSRASNREAGIELTAGVLAALESGAAEVGVPFDLVEPAGAPTVPGQG